VNELSLDARTIAKRRDENPCRIENRREIGDEALYLGTVIAERQNIGTGIRTDKHELCIGGQSLAKPGPNSFLQVDRCIDIRQMTEAAEKDDMAARGREPLFRILRHSEDVRENQGGVSRGGLFTNDHLEFGRGEEHRAVRIGDKTHLHLLRRRRSAAHLIVIRE